MPKKAVPVIVIGIALALTLSLMFMLFPAFAGPQIDETWVIAYNAKDMYDTKSAEWVRDEYNATLVDINEPYEWDKFGQNIFIIGGSKALSIEAQWLGLKPIWYSIAKPDTYPDVEWAKNDAGELAIITSARTLICDADHDYGMIAKGYDYTKRRWVIVVVGYSAYATALGSKFIIEDYKTVVEQHNYVVYEVTKKDTTTDIAQWSLSDFGGDIIEFGG